jgi:hypothetical protein
MNLQGADKYIGRILNDRGAEYYKDMIDEYGFIPEQCSDTSGVEISFDKEYRVIEIKGFKINKRAGFGRLSADKLPKVAMDHLDVFITFITDKAKEII